MIAVLTYCMWRATDFKVAKKWKDVWGACEGIRMGTEMLLMLSNIAGKTIFNNEVI